MRTALLPGSFNPPTLGHLDIITKAAKLSERLIVAVIANPRKKIGFFSLEERKGLLAKLCAPLTNVSVTTFQGLLVNFVKENQISYIVKGLRTGMDFDYEQQMAVANRMMAGIDTVFLPPSPENAHISSSLVREIGSLGHRLHGFVPAEIEAVVYEKLSSTKEPLWTAS
jgi:pantetheine-phosphate adenylyltransferase